MVSKDVITKSLEDAVFKCKYGKILGNCTFPPMLMSSLNKFYEMKHTNPIEEAFVFNEQGEIISTHKGGEDHVFVFPDDEQINQLRMGHKLHVTHNHPIDDTDSTFKKYSNCLSKADMMGLLRTVTVDGEQVLREMSITAESPYGARMTLHNKNPLQYNNRENFEKAVDNLLKSDKEFNKNYFDEMSDYYMNLVKDIPLKEVVLPNGTIETRYEEPSYSNMLKKLYKYNYNYVKNNYYKFIKNNINEFEELDCELSIRYL